MNGFTAMKNKGNVNKERILDKKAWSEIGRNEVQYELNDSD